MTYEDILHSTQDAIADVLAINVCKCLPEKSIRDELGADSLDLVEIAMAVEHKLLIDIDDAALERVKTVSDLAGEAAKAAKIAVSA